MKENFYITYMLPCENSSRIFPLNSDSLENALKELNNSVNDLLLLGASDIHICNTDGIIVYKYNN